MLFTSARKIFLSCEKLVFRALSLRRLANASQDEKLFDSNLEQFVRSQWDKTVNAENPVVQRLKQEILAGNRSALAESITLVESRNPTKKAQGEYLLAELLRESQQNPKKMIFRVGKYPYFFFTK